MKEILLVDNQSAASTITSVPVDLGNYTDFSFQAVFTGTLSGTFSINASLTPSNFINIPASATTVTNGDDVMLVVTNGTYRYVTATWAPTSGTGNMTLRFLLKQLVGG